MYKKLPRNTAPNDENGVSIRVFKLPINKKSKRLKHRFEVRLHKLTRILVLIKSLKHRLVIRKKT